MTSLMDNPGLSNTIPSQDLPRYITRSWNLFSLQADTSFLLKTVLNSGQATEQLSLIIMVSSMNHQNTRTC